MTVANPLISVLLPVQASRLAHAQWAIADYGRQDLKDCAHELVISTRDVEVARFLDRWVVEYGIKNVSVVVPLASSRFDSIILAAQLRASGVFLAIWSDAGRYGESWLRRAYEAMLRQAEPGRAIVVPGAIVVDVPGTGLVYCGEETTVPRMVEAVPAIAANGNRPGRPAQMALEGPGLIYPSIPCLFARSAAPAWGQMAANSVEQLTAGMIAGTAPQIDRVVAMTGAAQTVLTRPEADDETLRAFAYRRGSEKIGDLLALPPFPVVRTVHTTVDNRFEAADKLEAVKFPVGLPELKDPS